MRNPVPALNLKPADRDHLERLVRGRKTPQRVALRARIVLLAGQGIANLAIARRAGVSRPTVVLWRERFGALGVAGLLRDAPRPGRRPKLTAAKRAAILRDTVSGKPEGATHWSTRTLAGKHGVSSATIQRLWKVHGLKPHLTRKFKLSRDPRFEEKVIDIIGLYTHPPENAVVLCVDEKTQVQALDRTQPGLPMKKGRAGTMTHDYKRHGTTALYAGLDVVTGAVLGQCHERHRHQEFIKFLELIERTAPGERAVHVVVDNSSTHSTPQVRAWLSRHPRFTLHFTPTSASWLNLVERWFAEITRRRIRRGSFKSVQELVEAILDYIRIHNLEPAPYLWSAPASAVIAKVRKCKEVLETEH